MSTPTQTGSPEVLTRAAALVDLGLRACEAYRRPDLAARLTATRRTLDDPGIHIVVAGEFKQGKSSLVNALLGAAVCPVDDDLATAVPTYLRYGPELRAEVLHHGDPPRREPIEFDRLPDYVVERAQSNGAATERIAGVIISLPRTMLATGLVIVDTPGVGGLSSAYAAASLAAIAMADAVLFVTDASQELTAAELEFLRRAREVCDSVVCVLTKTDFYPAWRTIRSLDEQHLRTRAEMPLLPVSSTLRARAVRSNDAALNAESGFAELVGFVNGRIAGGAAARLAVDAAHDVVAVCEQLIGQFEAERAVLADPTRGQQVIEDLTAVKSRIEALRSTAARWSQTLNDGTADLNSDVDHDLRARMRGVVSEADDLIEDLDPADVWSEVEAWLKTRASEELLANYALLRFKADELSEEVWQHFKEASGEVFDQLAVYNPTTLLGRAQVEHKMDLDKMGLGKQAMTALRSSYMGILMFTMLGSMAGIALGPIAVGIGLAMGLGGLRTEKRRQLMQRRAQANNAVRRYCDEVSFVMSKDSRDTLRRIQRQLRDHYSARAEELNRTNAQALQAATDAANRTQADRQKRVADLDAELARLRELRARAMAVSG